MTIARDQARELLAFYREAGVDALLEETPTDRFAGDEAAPRAEPARARAEAPTSAAARALPGRAPAVESRIAPPPPPEAAVMAAREAAKSAATLEELQAMLERFEGCALRTTATQLVFADGNPKAGVMFVGEAPGRDEDIEGLPFVGRSGKLLDRKDGILKTRGRWFPFHAGTREIRAIATLHPAYLLRQPLQKRFAWRDFLAIKKALAN